MSCIIPGLDFKFKITIKFKKDFDFFDPKMFYYKLIYRLSLLNAGRLSPEIIINKVIINHKTNSVTYIVVFKNVQDVNDVKYFKSCAGKNGIKKTIIRMFEEKKKTIKDFIVSVH